MERELVIRTIQLYYLRVEANTIMNINNKLKSPIGITGDIYCTNVVGSSTPANTAVYEVKKPT